MGEQEQGVEPVAELAAMLDAATKEEGCTIFDHTPEEIGLRVMENHAAIREAIGAALTIERYRSLPNQTAPDKALAMSDTAWLIEGSHLFPETPHWWHPKKGWVTDANEALRFAREIDAAEFAQSMAHGAGGTATEHTFIESAL